MIMNTLIHEFVNETPLNLLAVLNICVYIWYKKYLWNNLENWWPNALNMYYGDAQFMNCKLHMTVWAANNGALYVFNMSGEA